VPRRPIVLATARAQHAAYERTLAEVGCRVERLPASDDMPDSVFIEDTAVVFDELAVLMRPGAPSRRPEVAAVGTRLGHWRPIHPIEAPGTIDGGDVLTVGRRVFVGRSARTNDAAIDQLRRILAPHGYTVEAVDVRGCLHLKSAVTAIGDDRLLVNPEWVPSGAFDAFECVAIDPSEPYAANGLRVGAHVVYPSSFPNTAERLARHGVQLALVDVTELQKAEGAVTCCSVIFRQ